VHSVHWIFLLEQRENCAGRSTARSAGWRVSADVDGRDMAQRRLRFHGGLGAGIDRRPAQTPSLCHSPSHWQPPKNSQETPKHNWITREASNALPTSARACTSATLRGWVAWLRWQKPSCRFILLIPQPAGPSGLHARGAPAAALVGLIWSWRLAVKRWPLCRQRPLGTGASTLVERTKRPTLAKCRVRCGASAAVPFCSCICLCWPCWLVGLLARRRRGAALLLALATLRRCCSYPLPNGWLLFPPVAAGLLLGFAVLIPWLRPPVRFARWLAPGTV